MLSKKMEKALNDQINAEMYSSYLYLSMATCLEASSLEGFAHWMEIQAQEEMIHAMKFYKYVNDKGGRVHLGAIKEPPTDFGGPLHVFEEVAKHEAHVTSLIYKLVDVARAESDHGTENFLQWFVSEQVEEEANAAKLVSRLKMAGDSQQAFLMFDAQLAARPAPITVNTPSAT